VGSFYAGFEIDDIKPSDKTLLIAFFAKSIADE
jgi:hypothetical protein